MAQHKYDMLTVDTTKRPAGRSHPWYKERLKLKFLKNSKQSVVLDGSKWRFISGYADDFRMGPPLKCAKVIKRKELNSVPLVKNEFQLTNKISSHHVPTTPSRTLFNKVGPRKQIQLDRVNRVESGLLSHPLLLYPHLEECIPPDIVDDVAEILDPMINELITDCESEQSDQETLKEDEGEDVAMDNITVPAPSCEQPRNIYKFPLMKTDEEREMELDLIASRQDISAKQQSRVKQVTHDLVEWGKQLGGTEDSSCTIDEHTIKSLFGSDYESKPILMAPIQVVELANIPPELQVDSRIQSTTNSTRPSSHYPPISALHYQGYRRIRPGVGDDIMPWLIKDREEPRVVKTKYGAWYLPVELWKLHYSDEPLDDPNKECDEMRTDQATRTLEMDKKISVLHGAQAFREFILNGKNGARMPTFLQSINSFQSHSAKSSKKSISTPHYS